MKPFIAICFVLSTFAAPLAAQSIEGQITDQLRDQGYENVQVTKTWLGRLRIQAASDEQTREIIVNPRTGEILRDFQTNTSGERAVQILQRPAKPSRSGGAVPDDQKPERATPSDHGPAPQADRPSGPSGQNGAGGRSGPSGPSGTGGPSR